MRSPRRTALVTGASSGIGYELATLLAQDHYDLVLVARNETALRQLADELVKRQGITCTVLADDLSDSHTPERLVARLREASLDIDVLVNNAGFGTHGPFVEADVASQLQMIQVNLVALTHLTRLLVPSMVSRTWGRVLNVASTAAFQPGPLMAVYYATKAYVVSFSEAVGHELRGSGVTITALCPGPTRTEFQRRAGVEDTPLMRGRIMDARTVALAGYRGLMQGRSLVIPGVRNRVLAGLTRVVPRQITLEIVRRIQESRKRF